MDFEDKDRLYDIKLSVERRRKETESMPSLRIPISYAEKFLKTYKKKLEPLEKKITESWDEPDKMYDLKHEYDELEGFVTELEEYIKAMNNYKNRLTHN